MEMNKRMRAEILYAKSADLDRSALSEHDSKMGIVCTKHGVCPFKDF